MTQSKSERTEQRRRILRAAASAPVILTLPSGAALAATSVTCAQKSQELAQTSPPAGVASAPDTWMRFEVDVFSFDGSVSSTSTSAFLDASATSTTTTDTDTVSSLQAEAPIYFTLNDRWYEVLADGTAVRVDAPTGVRVDAGTRYVLVDYAAYREEADPTFYVYPVYPGDAAVVNPISGVSCWNSLTGANLTSTVIN